MPQRQLRSSNRFLSSLPRDVSQQLVANLEVVDLAAGQMLSEPGEVMRYVYFPVSALLTFLATIDEDTEFAVGMVGREGICNVTCALGSYRSPFRTVVQCPGQALRMKANVFVKHFRDSEVLRDQVLKFVLKLNVHMAQTAACTRYHEIDQRLARWLLMTRNCLSSDKFNITHEVLSNYLGVRRVGVTHSAKTLKERKLISYVRGAVHIINAAGLEEVSCPCHTLKVGVS